MIVRLHLLRYAIATGALVLAGSGRNAIAAPPARPNVVVIVADDLGYSDLGCQGGEIATPNLDRLAANGLRFTQFYNTARCWSSRASILTGYYAHQVRRDKMPGVVSGANGVRPKWAKLLPEMLKSAGYRSYHSGKWHVDGLPTANGFDHSYNLVDGGRYFHPQSHFEDDRKLPPIKLGSGYYGTDAVADHSIKYLNEHETKYKDQPFFLYMAFHAPHFPLQAPAEDIAIYQDRYRVGWERIRAERAAKVRELGLVSSPLSEVEREIGPPYPFPDAIAKLGPGEVDRPLRWTDLTDLQRDFQSQKMAIHAAMVDRVDRQVGRVLDQIRAMNAFENTLIMFMSDNGASAEMMIRDDGHDPSAPLGSAATHACLGPGWSSVANTPFRRHKTWVHEGGISTPLVVHWPLGISARGELRHNPGHLIDLVPTILEVTGAKRFATWDDRPTPTPPGKSLLPAFMVDGVVTHKDLWFEHEGNRAILVGDWKLVAAKNTPWELYDFAKDRTETKNLAAELPEKVLELAKKWQQRIDEFTSLVLLDQIPAPAPPVQKPVKELILPGESFLVDGHPAFTLLPAKAKRRNPQPWIMYAPTLPGYPDSHEKWMHEQFLAAGVAVAGIDIGEAYGSPKGSELFSALHRKLTTNRGFAERPCLLGRSRGGLWVTSWAADHPEKVAGIAGIYPVFDFRTYPGIATAAPAYGLTPQQLEADLMKFNPIERVNLIAKQKVPVFLIHGDEDKVVPLRENSQEFANRYEKEGATDRITLMVIKGQGHNFWEGFFHCQELVDFAVARALAGASKIEGPKN